MNAPRVVTPSRPLGCPSDFVLDKLLAGDLAVSAAQTAREHIASCERCKNRLLELQRVEVPALEGSNAGQRRPIVATSKTRRGWRFAVACGAAALIPLFLLVRMKSERRDPLEEGVRTKGTTALGVIVQRASGATERLSPGGTLFPGDTLRFEVASSQPGFVAVVSVDQAGAATLYSPFQGEMHRLSTSTPVLLPDAVVADDVLGAERLIAVFCRERQPLEEVHSAAAAALSRSGKAPRSVAGLLRGCSESIFDVEKRNP